MDRITAGPGKTKPCKHKSYSILQTLKPAPKTRPESQPLKPDPKKVLLFLNHPLKLDPKNDWQTLKNFDDPKRVAVMIFNLYCNPINHKLI